MEGVEIEVEGTDRLSLYVIDEGHRVKDTSRCLLDKEYRSTILLPLLRGIANQSTQVYRDLWFRTNSHLEDFYLRSPLDRFGSTSSRQHRWKLMEHPSRS